MELYHIEPPEFEIVKRIQVNENSLQYNLRAADIWEHCPMCGSFNIKRNGKRKRKARDLSEHGMLVGLEVEVQRYYCMECENVWSDSFTALPEKAKMTTRMKRYIQGQAAKRPFLSIKNELDVSVPTIKQIFEEYVAGKDKNRQICAPEVLGLDENYLLKKYRAVYVDIENGRIIDMTEDRSLSTVKDWISKLPEKGRIKVVTMDMWGWYKEAVKAELPDIPIVVDKFHVIKNLNEALDSIRKRLRDCLSSSEQAHIRNNRWLLLRNNEDLSHSQRMFLHDLLESFPQFKEPYHLKESFRGIYKANSRDDAEELYDAWKVQAKVYPEYTSFIETVTNWHAEIFNYFDYHYTNATTESLNALAKEIAARGRGYSFPVLRYKVLYMTKAAKPPKYKYYEKDEPVIADMSNAGNLSYGFMTTISLRQQFGRIAKYSEMLMGAGTDVKELLKRLRNDEL